MRLFRIGMWFVLYSVGFCLLLLAFLANDHFFSEGKGAVKETFQRQEKDSDGDVRTVRYVRLESGTEVKVGYELWRRAKPGSSFAKERYSFAYRVDDFAVNELWEFLPFLVGASLVLGAIFGIRSGW
ncbi:MAG: hypothetical protein GX442_21915 [Candidatus Riflebacteria bacterium]|nr:hypothetical protein [Candidatus Riflebacteria bacterium]